MNDAEPQLIYTRLGRKLPNFKGLSFTTISGFGPNGSIIHYDPSEETKLPITANNMYLCDSGAQFM